MSTEKKPNPADAWNNRYKDPAFAYGTEPNEYLAQQLKGLKPGIILFPAEGEGRNAVYAAKLGWEVSAFDISIEGKKKALGLAEQNGVTVNYKIGKLDELGYQPEQFDVIALIYAHFPPNIRTQYLAELQNYLKPGGTIIIEAFGQNHLDYRSKNEKVGGPPVAELLYSTSEVSSIFKEMNHIYLREEEVSLQEGIYHNGKGSVVHFIGKK
jgi:2-polyprenyl-3-methyl-5-hydroxy-6-metoxy-1,4-benzoquinol methylase